MDNLISYAIICAMVSAAATEFSSLYSQYIQHLVETIVSAL